MCAILQGSVGAADVTPACIDDAEHTIAVSRGSHYLTRLYRVHDIQVRCQLLIPGVAGAAPQGMQWMYAAPVEKVFCIIADIILARQAVPSGLAPCHRSCLAVHWLICWKHILTQGIQKQAQIAQHCTWRHSSSDSKVAEEASHSDIPVCMKAGPVRVHLRSIQSSQQLVSVLQLQTSFRASRAHQDFPCQTRLAACPHATTTQMTTLR